MAKIGVFPASGKLGTSIYTHLLNLVDPKNVILVSRNPTKIPAGYVDAGVVTRQADYNTLDSLENVFNEVETLILISYPSIEYEHRVQAHKAAIDAAIQSGAKHIIYTSLAFGGDCSPTSQAHVMQAHLATEKYLLQLSSSNSITFTAVREGIYSESFPMYLGFVDLQGTEPEILIPDDGNGPGIAWAKIDELGEATARLAHSCYLNKNESEFLNKTILLSGPKVWSLSESVKALGNVTGKQLRIKQISREEYTTLPRIRESLGSHGPGPVPQQWATSYDGLSGGETAVPSELLGRLLGRKPEDFNVTISNMANEN